MNEFYRDQNPSQVSWDDKFAGSFVLLAQMTGEDRYISMYLSCWHRWLERTGIYLFVLLAQMTGEDRYNYKEASYLQLIWLSRKWQILKENLCWSVIVNYCLSLIQIFKLELSCFPISTSFWNWSFLQIYRLIYSWLPINVQLSYTNHQFDQLIMQNVII